MCIRTLISETRQKNVEIEGPEYESHSFFSVVSHFRQKIERSTGNLVQELNEVLYCKLLFVVTICEKIKNKKWTSFFGSPAFPVFPGV